MLKIYNSLTKKLEEFKPINDKLVKMYICGPTVYGPGHIGHARTYTIFDIIRRYLEYKKYKVKFIMNITDIHDDIIKEATKQNTNIFSLAEKHIKSFLQNQEILGNKKADKYPKVTENIKEIIKFIQELEKKGYTYVKDNSVYFSISKYKDYGKLSNIKVKKTITGTRIDTDKYDKENISDFVLWKKSKPNEPYWDSPWGKGRPGWHTECSVLIKKYLGEQIDIHGGGRDLIFPHHENEIAQSEAVSEKKPFVKYWMHAGFLTINNQKMSKSLGNYIEIDNALKEYNPRIIRFFIASAHYRSPLNWEKLYLIKPKESLKRIDEFISKLKNIEGKRKEANIELEKWKSSFIKAMNDDFNTPKALATLFTMIKEYNILLDKNEITKKQSSEILNFLEDIDNIFNFLIKKEKEIPKEILDLVKRRAILRKKKEWKKADKLRKEINQKGYQIEDTSKGTEINEI